MFLSVFVHMMKIIRVLILDPFDFHCMEKKNIYIYLYILYYAVVAKIIRTLGIFKRFQLLFSKRTMTLNILLTIAETTCDRRNLLEH